MREGQNSIEQTNLTRFRHQNQMEQTSQQSAYTEVNWERLNGLQPRDPQLRAPAAAAPPERGVLEITPINWIINQSARGEGANSGERRLGPMNEPSPHHLKIQNLIADLDSPSYQTRQRAAAFLMVQGLR